jgi:hypothetical protein
MINSILVKATLRILRTGLLLFLALNTFNLASAESGSHETAYAEALHRVVTAQDLLLEEMRKIQSGEVAHYDFLQHAHIELLRDARGLRHSPASLPAVKRTALQEQAAQVLQLAGAMEWTLADFLRSHAQISGALASTIDLAQLARSGASETTQTALVGLGNAAQTYGQQPSSSALAALVRSFETALELSMHEQYREELTRQRDLISENAAPRQHAINAISTSGLGLAASQLQGLYDQSL